MELNSTDPIKVLYKGCNIVYSEEADIWSCDTQGTDSIKSGSLSEVKDLIDKDRLNSEGFSSYMVYYRDMSNIRIGRIIGVDGEQCRLETYDGLTIKDYPLTNTVEITEVSSSNYEDWCDAVEKSHEIFKERRTIEKAALFKVMDSFRGGGKSYDR